MSLVRTQREQAGLSMAEVARRAKIHPPTLCKIEHGQRALKVKEVAKLARAIGCQPSDLIPDCEEEIPTHA